MISRKTLSALTLVPLFLFLLSVSQIYAADTSPSPTLAGLAEQASSLSKGSLDINSATQELLAKVPGIGPQLSEAIVKYRDTNGAFKGIKDLLKVDGIDAGLIEKIRPFLTF